MSEPTAISGPPAQPEGIQIDVNAYVALWRQEASQATDRAIRAELAVASLQQQLAEATAAVEQATKAGKA